MVSVASRLGRGPIVWLSISVAAAVEVGVGVGELVVRPLVAHPLQFPALARLVVLGVTVLPLLWSLRQSRSVTTAGAADRAPSTRALADQPDDVVLAACVDVARRSQTRDRSDAVPLAVHTGGRIVEIFWDRSPPAPHPPWHGTRSGWVWEAARSQLEIPATGPDPALAAAHVTIGSTPTGWLWLNLEAFQVVSLVGVPIGVERLARHLLGQLRSRASAGTLELDLRLATSATSRGVTAPRGGAPRRGDRRVAFANRARGREAIAVHPRVSVVAAGGSTRLTNDVIDRCGGHQGRTFIVLGPVAGADLCLACHDTDVHVPFLGDLRVQVHPHDRVSWSGPSPPVTPRPAPVPSAPEPGSTAVPRPDATRPDRADESVEVRLLGPVEVRGCPQRLAGKSLELVAYLATHRDGAHEDQIRDALWPDRPLRSNSWATRVSITRAALGPGPDGKPRLERFRDHVGRLTSDVRVDVDTLAEALAHNDSNGVRAALASVRGRPFAARRGFDWAQREAHIARAERLVVDAAHRLSALAWSAGDRSEARWAAEQGLSACPDSELLHQDRRRASGSSDGGDAGPPTPEAAVHHTEAETRHRDTRALDQLLERDETPHPA